MSIVLYASETKLSDEQVALTVKGWRDRNGNPAPDKTIYIRTELMQDVWPGPAVSKAKPLPGEVCVNAIPNSVVVVSKAKA